MSTSTDTTSGVIREIAESVGVMLKRKQLSALTSFVQVVMSLLHFSWVNTSS